MAREKQGYRDTLALLIERYPRQGMLNKKETAEFMGVSVDTVDRRGIKFNHGRVALPDLARQICI